MRNFDKIRQWLMTSVGISLIPILAKCIMSDLQGLEAQGFLTWECLSPHGELLIVAAAILGESINELLNMSRHKQIRTILGGISILMLMLATFLYVEISREQPSLLQINQVIEISKIFFILSLIIGFFCKYLSPKSK